MKRMIRDAFILLIACSMGMQVNAQDNTGYAPVNGLSMYYEVYGEGEPLILIHGGLGGIVEFGGLIPVLAEAHQVIAVELQGHGRTADTDRPLSYEALADDIAALIGYLGYDQADVMGFSLGGGVALQTAVRHPERVRNLVLISTPYARDGIHPEFLMGMAAMSAETADMMLETPMYGFYSAVAPNVDDWSALVGKIGDMLRQDYDWSASVAALTTPTLIVVGDADMIPPAHTVTMFELMGGGVPGDFAERPESQMAILPGTTHFSILAQPQLIASLITGFLSEVRPESE